MAITEMVLTAFATITQEVWLLKFQILVYTVYCIFLASHAHRLTIPLFTCRKNPGYKASILLPCSHVPT